MNDASSIFAKEVIKCIFQQRFLRKYSKKSTVQKKNKLNLQSLFICLFNLNVKMSTESRKKIISQPISNVEAK